MAGGARLKPRIGPRLLMLLALVLVLHALTLQWLGRYLERKSDLKPLATPMFTRLVKPEAPPAPPAPAPRAAPAKPKRPAITAIAKPQSIARPTAAAAPMPPASAPAPETPSTASAPPPPLPMPMPPPTPETQVAAAAAAPAASAASAPAAPAAPPSAFVIGPNPPPVDFPADTRVSYRLGGQYRNGELHGSARVQWQRQGTKYETRVDIDVTLLASLVLTSQGDVTPQGLFPRAYEEMRRNGPRSNRLGDDSIVLNDGRTVPRPQGVQDTASQFVELGHRFATGQEVLEVGRSINLWMARPGAVDLWTYDVVAREMLQTPQLGAVEAFHLKPRPIENPRGNITAEMWFAPSLQYLPVRIKVSMGDATWVDLMVDKIEQR